MPLFIYLLHTIPTLKTYWRLLDILSRGGAQYAPHFSQSFSMDAIHIRNLVQQISSEVQCPHCMTQVRPDMIFVENFDQDHCLFRIECCECGEQFHGHAHVGVRVLPETHIPGPPKNTPNTKAPLAVSQQEISTIKDTLNSQDFHVSQLFTQKK